MDNINFLFGSMLEDFFNFFSGKDFNQDFVFLRLIVAGVAALLVSFIIIRFANRFLPKIAEIITDRTAARTQGDKLLMLRRTETVLSIAAAIGRATIVGLSLYIAWRLVNPGSAPIAIIGASTFFFIIGVATISPLLRDITSGIIMITERWYEVGDHVVVDPFWEMSGVVEQVNLRSTRLRSLDGEVIWIHNQNIQGVRVTPRGLRTISIDLFVRDREHGHSLINKVLPTLPVGSSMIATPLRVSGEEQLGDMWRITVTGQTTPGREWLIDKFAIQAFSKVDGEDKKGPAMIYDPISRYTDEAAERRFLRSIRGKQGKENKTDAHRHHQ